MLLGDFNTRTGKLKDYACLDNFWQTIRITAIIRKYKCIVRLKYLT